MSTKNVNNYKWKIFVIFLDNCLHKSIKHETADREASVKWNEVKGKPDKINELILKMKAGLKEGPDNI